jgi:hypothetical protein
MTLEDCSNEELTIQSVRPKPYVSDGRGACERFNRTVKEPFESEVRGREEFLSLDEVNAYFEAWIAERYHQLVRMRTKGGNTP